MGCNRRLKLKNEGMNIQFHGTSQQGKGVFVQPVPEDAISVNPTSYNFDTGGGLQNQVSIVTCSEAGISSNWTAAVTSDTNGIIIWCSESGADGAYIGVECENVGQNPHNGCVTATITLTCGTATTELTISQDGSITTCS